MPDILYEDDSLLAVRKPAGQESQRGRDLSMDLESELKNYLARSTHRPDPYLAVVHRLDRPAAGVMVYAKTKNAAAVLSRSFSKGENQKEYEALTLGVPGNSEGTLTDWILPAAGSNYSLIADLPDSSAPEVKGARRAVLKYHVIPESELECFSVDSKADSFGEHRILCGGRSIGSAADGAVSGIGRLRITLLTGRHHQIRVQLAHAGCPVLGDTKYGRPADGIRIRRGAVALAAVKLSLRHPATGRIMTFTWDGRIIYD